MPLVAPPKRAAPTAPPKPVRPSDAPSEGGAAMDDSFSQIHSALAVNAMDADDGTPMSKKVAASQPSSKREGDRPSYQPPFRRMRRRFGLFATFPQLFQPTNMFDPPLDPRLHDGREHNARRAVSCMTVYYCYLTVT